MTTTPPPTVAHAMCITHSFCFEERRKRLFCKASKTKTTELLHMNQAAHAERRMC